MSKYNKVLADIRLTKFVFHKLVTCKSDKFESANTLGKIEKVKKITKDIFGARAYNSS